MPLRLVWPISHADVNRLAANVDLFRALGGAPRHPMMLLPTRSVTSHAHQAAERLKPYAASVEVIEWDDDNVQNWPISGNRMWQHACREIMKKLRLGNDHTPWLYMEQDCTLLVPGAIDKLEQEYALIGKRCMGTEAPSRMPIGDPKEGKFTTAEFIPGQARNITFMPSVCIFPADIHAMTDGVYGTQFGNAWDKDLKFYFNRSRHITKLIQHQWRTERFEEVDGEIIGKDSKENVEQQYTEGGPVSKEAVIHHGCRDGSLGKIIRARQGELPPAPEPIPEPPKARPKQAPQANVPAPRDPGKVQFDNQGWTVLQNSLIGPNAPKPPPVLETREIPPLEFEPEEQPKFQEPKAAKRKPGRPKKRVVQTVS